LPMHTGRPPCCQRSCLHWPLTPTRIDRLSLTLTRVTQARPTWPKPAYNLQFLIPHTLGDPLERTDAIHWWLGLGNYELFMSLEQLRAIGSVG